MFKIFFAYSGKYRLIHVPANCITFFICFMKDGSHSVVYVSLIILLFRRYTTYKTVVLLQLVKFGYMFRPLHGHHQANKE